MSQKLIRQPPWLPLLCQHTSWLLVRGSAGLLGLGTGGRRPQFSCGVKAKPADQQAIFWGSMHEERGRGSGQQDTVFRKEEDREAAQRRSPASGRISCWFPPPHKLHSRPQASCTMWQHMHPDCAGVGHAPQQRGQCTHTQQTPERGVLCTSMYPPVLPIPPRTSVLFTCLRARLSTLHQRGGTHRPHNRQDPSTCTRLIPLLHTTL